MRRGRGADFTSLFTMEFRFIVLFATLGGSLWLVARDCRRRRSVSSFVWIAILMILVLATKPLSEWFGIASVKTATLDSVDGSPLDRTFNLILITCACVTIFCRRINWTRMIGSNLAIAVFYLYFLISVVWSGNPMGSFKRCFKDFGYVAIILVLGSEKEPTEAIRASYVRSAYILLPASVVLVRYFPEVSRGYSSIGEVVISGPTGQKNSLGQMVIICMLFLMWDYIHERRADGGQGRRSKIPWTTFALLIMGGWLLHVSDSKTSLACLVIGMVLLLRRGRSWISSAAINRLILCCALSLPLFLLFGQQFTALAAPIVEDMGRDLTFTGRTEIWQHVIDSPINPVLGSGFYNFWGESGGAAIRNAMNEPRLVSSHDGYLEIYLDGGIVGVALLLWVIVGAGLRLSKNTVGDHYRHLRFALLILAIFYNLTEAMYARPTLIWFTTLLVAMELPASRSGVIAKEQLPWTQQTSTAWERSAYVS